jgi:hypothetical protein
MIAMTKVLYRDSTSRPAQWLTRLLTYGDRQLLPSSKVAATWSWPCASNQFRGYEFAELYLWAPPGLHIMLKYRDNISYDDDDNDELRAAELFLRIWNLPGSQDIPSVLCTRKFITLFQKPASIPGRCNQIPYEGFRFIHRSPRYCWFSHVSSFFTFRLLLYPDDRGSTLCRNATLRLI